MEQMYLPGTIRERIQDLMKKYRITQVELGDKIGLSDSALSRFLSSKTDKLGDEYILKIADYFNVSADFILGQTDFPERRNYDIEELGLSYKAAMVLYTGTVDTDVVNRILESPQFPEITHMISRFFSDTFAEGFAARNAVLDSVRQLAAANEEVVHLIDAQMIQPDTVDLERIQAALMEMLKTIKAGIQTQTPTTVSLTKQASQEMMQEMKKGENVASGKLTLTPEDIIKVSAGITGTTQEFGEKFYGLMTDFLTGAADLIKEQGLMPDGSTDK